MTTQEKKIIDFEVSLLEVILLVLVVIMEFIHINEVVMWFINKIVIVILIKTIIIIIVIIIIINIIIITSETGITIYNYKSHRKLVNVKGLKKKID